MQFLCIKSERVNARSVSAKTEIYAFKETDIQVYLSILILNASVSVQYVPWSTVNCG